MEKWLYIFIQKYYSNNLLSLIKYAIVKTYSNIIILNHTMKCKIIIFNLNSLLKLY